ncbi:MAG: hypothetical protein EPN93_12130 [Spirochaetes bacterium]|nr:MAG: hypothetical protein EPN93_12130 [Spirochaetota bacterium]
MVTTSINMAPATRDSIAGAAQRLGKTQHEIIVELLTRLMRDVHQLLGGFTGVRRQTGKPEGGWYCFCIRFNAEEYEYFTDMRKLCKKSVSLLVAIAVKKYMAELLAKENSELINYIRYKGSAVSFSNSDGIACWQLYWGTPSPGITRQGEKIVRRTGYAC